MSIRPAARAMAALLVLLVAACDDPGPTTPSGPVPEIVRVDPAEVAPSPAPQTIVVSGQGFAAGLVVLLTTPDGARTTISGDAIQTVQSVSFQISLPFPAAGDYLIAVQLLNGAASNEAKIVARAAGGTAPRINSVTPASVQSGPNTTIVTLNGVNFTSDASVNLTTPDGVTAVVPSSAIVGVSSTSIQLTVVFSTPGTYAFSVRNGQGDTSNTIPVTAF
jgi:hypothetical protein